MPVSDRPLGPRELAERTGVSTDTLRHYERLGLLSPAPRTRAGYRRFPPDAVARVLLIQRALVVGFSLAELGRVLHQRDKGGAPCRDVHALVSDRLAGLDRQIAELQALRTELTSVVEEWDARLATTPAGRPAHLLDDLAGRPAIEHARSHRAAHSKPKR